MLTEAAGTTAPTLAELLARGPLEVTRALTLLRQLCDALEPTHRAGLIHRDVRPATIVIERELARLPQPGEASADDSYRAPEERTGGKLDHRCDQFALGVIAHEMFAPGVQDVLLAAIVRKMMATRPDDRFTNLRAVKQILELLATDRNRAAALLGLPVAEHAIPARRRTPGPLPVVAKPGARWPWLAGAGALVVAGVIAIVATRPGPDPAPAPRAQPLAEPTAQQVLDRYRQVGAQVAQTGDAAQTHRYRSIEISHAVRTPGERRAAMTLLDEIARALR